MSFTSESILSTRNHVRWNIFHFVTWSENNDQGSNKPRTLKHGTFNATVIAAQTSPMWDLTYWVMSVPYFSHMSVLYPSNFQWIWWPTFHHDIIISEELEWENITLKTAWVHNPAVGSLSLTTCRTTHCKIHRPRLFRTQPDNIKFWRRTQKDINSHCSILSRQAKPQVLYEERLYQITA